MSDAMRAGCRAAFCVLFLLSAVAAGEEPPRVAPARAPSLPAAVEALEATPQAAFDFVRRHIAWRPYAGFVKGPHGAFADGAANSADAAELLLYVLQSKGIEARLAFGTLSGERVDALLSGLLAPVEMDPDVKAALPGAEVEGPGDDPGLRELAAAHVWVQARQEDSWIDLAPLVAGAPGAAPAEVENTAEEPDPADRRMVRIEVFAKLRGEDPRPVLGHEAPASVLRGLRIVLLNQGVDDASRDRRAPVARLWPALVVGDEVVEGESYGGGARAGVRGDPASRLGGIFGAGGEGEGEKAADDPVVEEVVLSVALFGANLPERSQHRYLYLAGEDGLDRLDDLTAFAVGFGAPPIGRAGRLAEGAFASASKTRDVRLPKSGELDEAQVEAAGAMIDGAASLAGAAALRLFDVSGRMLAGLDRVHGTVSDATDVRIAACSLDPRSGALSTDLLFDSIDSWPRPGSRAGAGAALAGLRGILQADVEGAVLSAICGKAGMAGVRVLTVRSVLEAALSKEIELLGLVLEQPEGLSKLTAPERVRRIIGERLEQGRIVIVPARPVLLGERSVTAWYEIDRDTGEWIGVFEDGRHQAVAETEVLRKVVGLGANYVGNFWGQHGVTLFRYAKAMLEQAGDEERSYEEMRARALEEAARPEVMRALGKALFAMVTWYAKSPGEAMANLLVGLKAQSDGHEAALRRLRAITE